ncbi:uncharacterized protein [Aegilops tauschii subsp. strangulata]|uniref:uncharacterized protein n=1 Tax=Aegilops tauschii subsp. strangulata TaxID=200361 RepID=UPI003CC857B5
MDEQMMDAGNNRKRPQASEPAAATLGARTTKSSGSNESALLALPPAPWTTLKSRDLSHPPSRAATLPNPHRDPFHPTRSLRPPPSFCVAAQPQQALLDHPSTPPATHKLPHARGCPPRLRASASPETGLAAAQARPLLQPCPCPPPRAAPPDLSFSRAPLPRARDLASIPGPELRSAIPASSVSRSSASTPAGSGRIGSGPRCSSSAALVASRPDSSDPCFVPLLVVPPTRSPTTQPAPFSSLLEELQQPRTTASTSPASSASSLQLAHAPLADLPLRLPKLRPRRRAPPLPSHRAVPASSASRSFAAANSLPLPSASPATSRATAAPTRRASAPSPAKSGAPWPDPPSPARR